MAVPFLDLRAQLSRYRDEAMTRIAELVDAQRFILGPDVAAFERALAEYVGVPHAIGVSSGTDALLISLMAAGVSPGDEVVTTPFTFFATAGVVSRLGARPVFADIDPGTFNLDLDKTRAAITTRTRAVIPVHLFGQICDLGAWPADGPVLVEDAAQSLGAAIAGRQAGHFGHYGCFSFFPSKNLGGFGDGGAVVVRDEALADRVRCLRVHGSKPKYYHHIVGGNFRLDALQAAVLGVKLPHLDDWTQGRQRNAERYDALFEEHGLISRGLVRPPHRPKGVKHVFNQYVVRCEQRDGLRTHLSERGIGTMVYYPMALHVQPCFRHLGYGPGDFPESEKACSEVLALPIYSEVSSAQLAEVVNAIAEFYGV